MEGDARRCTVPVTISGTHRQPVRTCVGCRRRDEQNALLRVVAVRNQDPATPGWRLVPDERRRAPGRGAYVHPVPECLQAAIARRAFGRALRLPARVQVDLTAVQERLRQQS